MRIVVVGSINTDLVVRVSRFPVPGETIYGHQFDTYAGGKGANQAASAAKLGAEVVMLGAVGNDPYSDERLTDLRDAGVDTHCIIERAEVAGGIAIIQVDDSGENQIVLVPGANGTVSPDEVDATLGSLISRGDLLLVQLELPFDTVRRALESARAHGARTILNTAPIVEGADRLLPLIDVLVVNEVEAGQLLHREPISVDEAASAGAELVRLGPETVFTTLGAAGAVLNHDGAIETYTAPDVDVVDTTGAGDTTVGAFAAALAEENSVADAARYAVFAGSFAVQRPGAQPAQPTHDELERFIRERSS